MKRSLFILLFFFAFGIAAEAHQPFTLISSEKRAITFDDLVASEKMRTPGKKTGTTLTFTETDIRMVIATGPAEDMLSYRILGMRNPTFVVPAGATLRILFVNKDVDMRHDVRFGHVEGDFTASPALDMTAGSLRLDHIAADETMEAEEVVLKASENGVYKYFCTVSGHAKGGMWGNIAVGVKPGDLKMPVKTEHVHSPDEDGAKPANPSKQPADKPKPGATPPVKKPHDMAGMDHSKMDKSSTPMASSTSIGDPSAREGSGTSWNPDSTPVYAHMKMFKDGGMLMLMGSAFIRYTEIGSTRDASVAGKGGRSRTDAPTMFMAMYTRPVGERSQLGLRAMASLDPAIQRGWGYPLLYQSGELFHGQPIHDRQHPHDLFSELAVTFSHKFDEKRSFFLYAGYPGEPALGPPTFMHRPSAANNPDAPISHHWQDATHITWGVVTGGFSFGKVKLEASAFNGREPDENRWAFDRPRLNSFSGRISWNPTKDWSFQISHGQLKNPEPAEPEIRVLRKTTASVSYNRAINENRNWASTFVWGQNYANGTRSNSFLLESNYDFHKNAVFGRFETVQKSGHDLVLDHPLDHGVYWVNAFSLGYVRDLVQGKGLDLGVGGMATINRNPSTLTPVYGGTTHGGWQLFLRIRPSKMKH